MMIKWINLLRVRTDDAEAVNRSIKEKKLLDPKHEMVSETN